MLFLLLLLLFIATQGVRSLTWGICHIFCISFELSYFALFQEMLEISYSSSSCLHWGLPHMWDEHETDCSLCNATWHKKFRYLLLLHMSNIKKSCRCMVRLSNKLKSLWLFSMQWGSPLFLNVNVSMSKLCKMSEQVRELELFFQVYFLYNANMLFSNHFWISIYFYVMHFTLFPIFSHRFHHKFSFNNVFYD